jgi:hypothetical protein
MPIGCNILMHAFNLHGLYLPYEKSIKIKQLFAFKRVKKRFHMKSQLRLSNCLASKEKDLIYFFLKKKMI